MDIALITGGLAVLGYLVNKNEEKDHNNYLFKKEFEDKNNNIVIKKYNKSNNDIYDNKSTRELDKEYDDKNYDLYSKSLKPDTNLVNGIWRLLNDEEANKRKKDIVNNAINKDLYNLKNINHNNIEPMMNIDSDYDDTSNGSYETDDTSNSLAYSNNNYNNNYNNNGDDDSVFSDDYSIPLVRDNIKRTNNNGKNFMRETNNNNSGTRSGVRSSDRASGKKISEYISDDDSSFGDSSYENSSRESFDNINTQVLNTQDNFFNDVKTSLAGNHKSYSNNNERQPKNEFEDQYDELRFDHEGIPGTMPPDRKLLKTFNENMNVIPESEFNADCDGRYGVTSEMGHNNMVPFFKSSSYGYNPMRDKQMESYATRNIELFTGSDQNPQFKHKQEVENLFPNETGKVESVTGMPNFSDYFESRYIPSQTRNGELLTQPIRTTPGLDLGYNQNGNTGRQDLYRVMPRNVDALRTINNPKVSYETPIVSGQKGHKGRVMGKQVQQGPDRFYYNSPDSMMPQVGEFEAPAIYGKYVIDPTNREMNGQKTYVAPVGAQVDKSTPEYLQGQFKNPFKKTYETSGPRNVQRDSGGQIIGQETWTANETNRESTNSGDKYVGGAGHNKTQGYLQNNENATPEFTNRNMNEANPIANMQGNKTQVPLINFMNYIPDVTKKQILLEDNGRKNITNISNSIKGYLFNSINAIPDDTLRSILTDKVIITNAKGNSDRGYLFNNANNVPDTNMRNISEDNLILGNLSNHEQSYLFNYMNNIPDTNLRNIINTLYSSGGLNIKGNHEQSYIVDYNNAVPDTTMRELTENVINLTNVSGPMDKGYLIDYINAVPDATMKQLTENNLHLGSMTPIQTKGYLLNYVNSIPDTTLREMSENNNQILNLKGNHMQDYMFNHDNAIPDQTLRNLIENITHLTNFKGNHSGDYLINYISSIPDATLRELTENTMNITNISPLKMKTYLINYVNATPDATLREMTENQQNIIGQKGNNNKSMMYNYENGIPDETNRTQTENQKNIIGQKGNHNESVMYNYENGTPDATNRAQTGNQKNITGVGSSFYNKEYMFNYKNGIPDETNRNQTENQKNITGQKGQGTQNRSRLDYNNALLNTAKEVIAKGRAPVPVKNNIGKTPLFMNYVFNDDNASERPIYSGVKQSGGIENELYSFAS
jgi:hypothetical protein